LTKYPDLGMTSAVNPNKLTPGEIKSIIEKIRKKYDEYIYKYFKPKTLKEAFEDRYIKALRSSVDVSAFFLAEISAIEELLAREEQKVRAEPEKNADFEKMDIADRVLEENRKKIEKYPDTPLHKDASLEVRKLLGALKAIESEYWMELSVALRGTAYSMNSTEMLALDSRLRLLCYAEKDDTPSFLVRYVGQLKKFPRNYALIEREEKEYILESAFFLNDLIVVLERVKRVYMDLNEEESRILESASQYVWDIISDFRLKEFRKKKEWERA
jgi:hypothetical protein